MRTGENDSRTYTQPVVTAAVADTNSAAHKATMDQTHVALRYQVLFDAIDEGFTIIEVIFDKENRPVDYRFLEVNPVFEAQTGLANAAGKTAKELVPDIEERWPAIYGKVVMTGESIRFTEEVKAINRWFNVYATRVGDEGSRMVAVLFKDVTAQKRNEIERERLLKAAQTSHEQLMAVFQQAPAFMCIFRSPEHAYEIVNERYRQLIGWRETAGRTVSQVLPEVVEQGYIQILDDVYATGQPYVGTGSRVVFQHDANGPLVERFIDFVTLPQRDASGKVDGILVHGVDVTERKRAEEQFRIERDRSQAVLDTMAEGFAMLGRDWTILYMNAEGLRIGGRPDAQVVGQNHWHVWPEYVGTALEQLYQRVMQTLQPETFESQHVYPDGSSAWLEVRAYPGIDGGLSIFFRDVTSRREAEKKLRDADRRKDEFLAMLAHELRNPLAPIGAAAELLQRVKLDEERVRTTSAVISRQVSHMTGLIDDLLDVSRVTRGLIELDKTALDIQHVINEAVEQVNPVIRSRGHELMMRLSPQQSLVWGDKKRLVQVLANILNNAAKYTAEGGHLALRTSVQDEEVLIEVTDDGIGMTPETAKQAFDLFAQAERSSDRSSGGLGLGLALVKSLVELHGGTVTCKSAGLGQGSTFTICLPRLAEQKQTASRAANENVASAMPAASLKILVVDDNVDAAAMLQLLLESMGHKVLVEHGPLRALEKAKLYKPQICLVDIGLPEIDGNEVARRLRVQPENASAVLVAVTGYGQESDRASTLAAGFDHHLVKPVDTAALTSILSAIRTI